MAPSKSPKCRSIITRDMTSYPLFVAIRMSATLFQLVVDTVL